MRTEEAVTAATGIPVGYTTLATFYACLIVAVAWILRRLAKAPMPASYEPEKVVS
jgi:cytochrome bd ubiquinol oxidase subunit I